MVALEALSMPVVHVAAKHALSWKTVHRIEFDAIGRWEQSRQTPPLRRVGIDEKYRGRKTRGFVTIVSNLDTGEPIWMADGRSIETVQSWIATLSDKEKAGITLFAMDMFDAFVAAIRSEPAFKNVPIVHDAFHVIKRAGEAIDELRRSVFFRAGDEMRRIGRGKRWLLLRPWESCTPSQQLELTSLLACNRTLARAYQFREQLRDLLCNATNNPEYFRVGFECLLRRIQRRDCKPLRKLHDTLRAKRDELAALVTHRPPTGRIEALNTSWEALVRRARGARDAQYLLRRLRFMVANPIRHERDVRRFLALDIAAPTSAAA
jgi:transposase